MKSQLPKKKWMIIHPPPWRMGTARMKWDKETDEGEKRGVSMESEAGTKKYVSTAYHDLIKIQY